MMSRVFFLVLFINLFASSPALAGIYRWVDENGKTQFSDRPVRGQNANEVEVNTLKNSYGGGDVLNRHRDLLDRYKDQDQQSEKAKQQAKQDEENEKKLKAKCLRSKDKLANYERSTLYTLDDQGKRVYYSEEKRELRIEELRQTIAKYCQ
jgi:hypothetical protein